MHGPSLGELSGSW